MRLRVLRTAAFGTWESPLALLCHQCLPLSPPPLRLAVGAQPHPIKTPPYLLHSHLPSPRGPLPCSGPVSASPSLPASCSPVTRCCFQLQSYGPLLPGASVGPQRTQRKHACKPLPGLCLPPTTSGRQTLLCSCFSPKRMLHTSLYSDCCHLRIEVPSHPPPLDKGFRLLSCTDGTWPARRGRSVNGCC